MGWILRGLLLALVALGAWTAAVGGLARLDAKERPHNALKLVADQPQALIALAERARADAKGAPDDAVLKLGARLLAAAPTSGLPLAYAGDARVRIEAGDDAKAEKLLAAAAARDPRSPYPVIGLAVAAARANRVPDTVDHLIRLTRLDPSRSTTYLQALAMIAQSPEGLAALEPKLAANAELRTKMTAQLNETSNDFDLLLRLNANSPSTRQQLIDRLVKQSGIEAAFATWLSLLPAGEARTIEWPYNPTFLANPAPGPFNWILHPEQVELQPKGGAYVVHYGRGTVLLADQTMLLQPGDYRFSAAMAGESKITGGALVWQITCRGQANPLADTGRAALAETKELRLAAFSVPAEGCPAQTLQLWGLPGEFPLWARATIDRVAIERAAVR